MSRRMSLPGADELFRSTAPAGPPAAAPDPAPVASVAAVPVPVTAVAPEPVVPAPLDRAAASTDDDLAPEPAVRRRPRPVGERRPSGRERHEEKITVYCSADELLDIERARLTLRSDYGIAIDRGRIIREALVVVLADLDGKGDQSILVRRLRGR